VCVYMDILRTCRTRDVIEMIIRRLIVFRGNRTARERIAFDPEHELRRRRLEPYNIYYYSQQ